MRLNSADWRWRGQSRAAAKRQDNEGFPTNEQETLRLVRSQQALNACMDHRQAKRRIITLQAIIRVVHHNQRLVQGEFPGKLAGLTLSALLGVASSLPPFSPLDFLRKLTLSIDKKSR